mmetsp:Transcript_2543/g.4267  ORF Transcript_2543/g.4267 Transcript_2543/m.4267 type:complete len:252 (-) Transcript_2543:584-1339(-)
MEAHAKRAITKLCPNPSCAKDYSCPKCTRFNKLHLNSQLDLLPQPKNFEPPAKEALRCDFFKEGKCLNKKNFFVPMFNHVQFLLDELRNCGLILEQIARRRLSIAQIPRQVHVDQIILDFIRPTEFHQLFELERASEKAQENSEESKAANGAIEALRCGWSKEFGLDEQTITLELKHSYQYLRVALQLHFAFQFLGPKRRAEIKQLVKSVQFSPHASAEFRSLMFKRQIDFVVRPFGISIERNYVFVKSIE